MVEKTEKSGQWITPDELADRDQRGGLTHIDMSSVREKTCGMLETKLADGWMMVEVFEMRDDKPVVAEMKIFPMPPTEREDGELLDARNYGHRSPETNGDVTPKGGVTTSLLRHVRLGMTHAAPILEDYREWLTDNKYVDLSSVAESLPESGKPSRAAKGEARRQTDEYYSRIAVDYERLCAEGNRAPVKTMAEERDVDIGKMRSHVHRARRNGFLSDVVQGQTGGTATAKAKRVIILDTAGKLIGKNAAGLKAWKEDS
jgi:hypothetical protein